MTKTINRQVWWGVREDGNNVLVEIGIECRDNYDAIELAEVIAKHMERGNLSLKFDGGKNGTRAVGMPFVYEIRYFDHTASYGDDSGDLKGLYETEALALKHAQNMADAMLGAFAQTGVAEVSTVIA